MTTRSFITLRCNCGRLAGCEVIEVSLRSPLSSGLPSSDAGDIEQPFEVNLMQRCFEKLRLVFLQ